MLDPESGQFLVTPQLGLPCGLCHMSKDFAQHVKYRVKCCLIFLDGFESVLAGMSFIISQDVILISKCTVGWK